MFLYRLIDRFSLEEVQQELEEKGLSDIFVIEDDAKGEILIGGCATHPIKIEKADLIEQKSTVDWEEQWALYAAHFSEGKAHIEIGNQTLLLYPGAGFGDLSHPTTALMLEMMPPYIRNESVIDLGTGSGILALSALLLGANQAIGIDIDSAALEHAQKNAKLNHLQATFAASLPQNRPTDNVFLMNMIFPEQIQLNPAQYNPLAKLWIVSGILESQSADYLIQAEDWGWRRIATHQKGEWMGWIFSKR